MKNICVLLLCLISTVSSAYSIEITGKVFGMDESRIRVPLMGANIKVLNIDKGAKTDKNGSFKINVSGTKSISVSYAGYRTDTLQLDGKQTNIEIELKPVLTGVVEVVAAQPAIKISKSAVNSTTITTTGLRKAACCNLAESFTTNPSVDVNYSDAVTGAKQIELLGLEGIYTQMMTENVPNIRGLSTTFGLNYVPGQWMESIQISKGAASVSSGYESITGQINVEYKKPQKSDPLFISLYANHEGRIEGDITSGLEVTDNLGTSIMLHANFFNRELDGNKDLFLDMPMEQQYSFLNRWEYDNNGLHTTQAIKILNEKRKAGQIGYFPNTDTSKYGIKIKTERYEYFGKIGYVLPTESYNSIAFQYALSTHDQNSYYGKTTYDANQKSFFGKLLYETRFGHATKESNHEDEEESHEGHNHEVNEESHTEVAADSDENFLHKINMGLSYNFDQFDENFKYYNYSKSAYNDTLINKIERVPGVFAEYTYSGIKNITMIAGGRFDFHNLYETFFTPRFHLRYTPTDKITLRASAGKGYHINNIYAENAGILASSRSIYIDEKLDPESAWNYGINATYDFNLFDQDFTLNAEYYRTDFINQVIADMERNPNEIHFYNLKGDSYSNSYQIDLTFKPIHGFEIMTAYRYNDVRMTVNGALIEKPLSSRYKAFINLAYVTDFEEWKFDFTATLNGGGRLPNTESNPENYRLDREFKPYPMLYAQITKKFGDLDIYVGGENLTNYMQENPIVAADAPYSKYFDGSMVWGPVMGRVIYFGVRYNAF